MRSKAFLFCFLLLSKIAFNEAFYRPRPMLLELSRNEDFAKAILNFFSIENPVEYKPRDECLVRPGSRAWVKNKCWAEYQVGFRPLRPLLGK